MSVLFGKWNFDGQVPSREYVEKVSETLLPFGPDSNERYSKGGLTILYRAFHTTKESHREVQPCILPSGEVITWDGRLDNRRELIETLGGSLSSESTDLLIVSAAYERWGTKCFGKLIGDWALSVCDPSYRTVILAKDFVGPRHLYYSFGNNDVTWSTILDPLVLFAEHPLEISEEYIADWIAVRFSATHLTPYMDIHAVPPASYVRLQPGKHGVKHTVSKYWNFDPSKKIRYRSDGEYEEHFRTVFAQSVQRRLRSDRPVLAELSGGMDSSSIVCMADLILAQAQGKTTLDSGAPATPQLNIPSISGLAPRLDTISWYDNSQPATDELPYVVKVEEKRGRPGFHIDNRELRAREVRPQGIFATEYEDDRLAVIPSQIKLPEFSRIYGSHMKSQGHRVILSGIAGDEIMAGVVPTPNPELQNLLARARFVSLFRQLNAWAAKMRKPRLPVLWEALREFLTATPLLEVGNTRARSALDAGFVRRNQAALRGRFRPRVRLFGPLPGFQDNRVVLSIIRRTLAGFHLRQEIQAEIRYSYLDRDLVEFMYAIPREQVVGVGKRRFLMKRALVGIDPDEILGKRQSAFISSGETKKDSADWAGLRDFGRDMISVKAGMIDANRFSESLLRAQEEGASIGGFHIMFMLESWLRHLIARGISIRLTSREITKRLSPPQARRIHTSPEPKSSAS